MQDHIAGMKNNLLCKLCPVMNLLFYIRFFFKSIYIYRYWGENIQSSPTGRRSATQYGSVMYSLQNQQNQTPREFFKYSKVARFRFPQALVTHVPEHPVSSRHCLLTLELLLHGNGGIKVSRQLLLFSKRFWGFVCNVATWRSLTVLYPWTRDNHNRVLFSPHIWIWSDIATS